MSYKKFKCLKLVLLMLVAVPLMAAPSFAVVKDLAVVEAEWLPPGGTTGDEIPMWAFVDDPVTCPTSPVTWSVGPKIVVPSTDSVLQINLRNCLPTGSEGVSVVIPGQAMPTDFSGTLLAPVFFTDSQGRSRVMSFTAEAAVSGPVQSYYWNSLQAGTYLYQSGTHPQVQVQMGLYGAVTKNSADAATDPAQAYAGVPYSTERDLFYSEVDPALHAAVAGGTFSGSTLNYNPKYFLLHGYDSGTSSWVDVSIDTGSIPPTCIDSGIGQGDRLLLRMYNAGLRELAPMLLGAHFDLVAEGGKKYPFARTQYETLLMPGSTKDAMFTPEYEADFKLIERRLNLTDAAATGGGMQTCITVGGIANNAPVVTITAPSDGTTVIEGTSISFQGTATDVEDDDIVLTASMSWTSSIDGPIGTGGGGPFSATLTPGTHTITASVTDSGLLPGSDSIIVTVNPANFAPVVTITAPPDGTTVTEGTSISFTGTATDVEDDDTALTASMSWTSSIDGAFGPGGGGPFSVTLTPGTHTITASVTDSGLLPGSDSITVTVNPANTAPVVTITNPSNGATFTQIDSIPFSGTASDAEEPGISGANLNWTSDIDGNIGTGASFSTTLSVETHTITASVTDTGAPPLEGSDSITVNIVPAATDNLTCKKADYKAGPDSLTIEVKSDDMPKGNRIITGVVGGGAPFNIPVKNAGSDVYRIVIQPYTDTIPPTPDPTGLSFTATSDIGGICTTTVN